MVKIDTHTDCIVGMRRTVRLCGPFLAEAAAEARWKILQWNDWRAPWASLILTPWAGLILTDSPSGLALGLVRTRPPGSSRGLLFDSVAQATAFLCWVS